MSRLRELTLLALLISVPILSHAQVCTIYGYVRFENGTGAQGATVRLLNTSSGTVVTVTAGTNGAWQTSQEWWNGTYLRINATYGDCLVDNVTMYITECPSGVGGLQQAPDMYLKPMMRTRIVEAPAMVAIGATGYSFRGYVENNWDNWLNGSWIRWEFPTGWEPTGSTELTGLNIPPKGIVWLNVTVDISATAERGYKNVSLKGNFTIPSPPVCPYTNNTTVQVVLNQLIIQIDVYPRNVTLGDLVQLKAYAWNGRNETVPGVWLNWTLPEGWVWQSGDPQNKSIGNMNYEQQNWSNITVLVTESSPSGYVLVMATVSNSTMIFDNDTVAIYVRKVGSKVTITQCPSTVAENQTGIVLRAELENIGLENLVNCSLNWSIPPETEWEVVAGSKTSFVSLLAPGNVLWNEITVNILPGAAGDTQKTVTVKAESNCTAQTNASEVFWRNDSRSVKVVRGGVFVEILSPANGTTFGRGQSDIEFIARVYNAWWDKTITNVWLNWTFPDVYCYYPSSCNWTITYGTVNKSIGSLGPMSYGYSTVRLNIGSNAKKGLLMLAANSTYVEGGIRKEANTSILIQVGDYLSAIWDSPRWGNTYVCDSGDGINPTVTLQCRIVNTFNSSQPAPSGYLVKWYYRKMGCLEDCNNRFGSGYDADTFLGSSYTNASGYASYSFSACNIAEYDGGGRARLINYEVKCKISDSGGYVAREDTGTSEIQIGGRDFYVELTARFFFSPSRSDLTPGSVPIRWSYVRLYGTNKRTDIGNPSAAVLHLPKSWEMKDSTMEVSHYARDVSGHKTCTMKMQTMKLLNFLFFASTEEGGRQQIVWSGWAHFDDYWFAIGLWGDDHHICAIGQTSAHNIGQLYDPNTGEVMPVVTTTEYWIGCSIPSISQGDPEGDKKWAKETILWWKEYITLLARNLGNFSKMYPWEEGTLFPSSKGSIGEFVHHLIATFDQWFMIYGDQVAQIGNYWFFQCVRPTGDMATACSLYPEACNRICRQQFEATADGIVMWSYLYEHLHKTWERRVSTFREDFKEFATILAQNLPNILGPPNGSNGLNYMLKAMNAQAGGSAFKKFANHIQFYFIGAPLGPDLMSITLPDAFLPSRTYDGSGWTYTSDPYGYRWTTPTLADHYMRMWIYGLEQIAIVLEAINFRAPKQIHETATDIWGTVYWGLKTMVNFYEQADKPLIKQATVRAIEKWPSSQQGDEDGYCSGEQDVGYSGCVASNPGHRCGLHCGGRNYVSIFPATDVWPPNKWFGGYHLLEATDGDFADFSSQLAEVIKQVSYFIPILFKHGPDGLPPEGEEPTVSDFVTLLFTYINWYMDTTYIKTNEYLYSDHIDDLCLWDFSLGDRHAPDWTRRILWRTCNLSGRLLNPSATTPQDAGACYNISGGPVGPDSCRDKWFRDDAWRAHWTNEFLRKIFDNMDWEKMREAAKALASGFADLLGPPDPSGGYGISYALCYARGARDVVVNRTIDTMVRASEWYVKSYFDRQNRLYRTLKYSEFVAHAETGRMLQIYGMRIARILFQTLTTMDGIHAEFYEDSVATKGGFTTLAYRLPYPYGKDVCDMNYALSCMWGSDSPVYLREAGVTDYFSAKFRGKLDVPATDTYTFYITVNDGAKLFIDGSLVPLSCNDGSPSWSDRSGAATCSGAKSLSKGKHDIEIWYYDASGDSRIILEWGSSAFSQRGVPVDAVSPGYLEESGKRLGGVLQWGFGFLNWFYSHFSDEQKWRITKEPVRRLADYFGDWEGTTGRTYTVKVDMGLSDEVKREWWQEIFLLLGAMNKFVGAAGFYTPQAIPEFTLASEQGINFIGNLADLAWYVLANFFDPNVVPNRNYYYDRYWAYTNWTLGSFVDDVERGIIKDAYVRYATSRYSEELNSILGYPNLTTGTNYLLFYLQQVPDGTISRFVDKILNLVPNASRFYAEMNDRFPNLFCWGGGCKDNPVHYSTLSKRRANYYWKWGNILLEDITSTEGLVGEYYQTTYNVSLRVASDDGADCYVASMKNKNGTRVINKLGQGRGLQYWNDIQDISPNVTAGKNVVSCVVNNSGGGPGGFDAEVYWVNASQFLIMHMDDDMMTYTSDDPRYPNGTCNPDTGEGCDVKCAENAWWSYSISQTCDTGAWASLDFSESGWTKYRNGPYGNGLVGFECYTQNKQILQEYRKACFRNSFTLPYFADENLRLMRIDEQINFDWGSGWGGDTEAAKVLSPDYFAVRWRGILKVPQSGSYSFRVGSDDGMRLYIDDAKVLEYWDLRSYATNTTSVYLTAGDHSILLEYFEHTGNARVTLEWSGPPTGGVFAIINKTYLRTHSDEIKESTGASFWGAMYGWSAVVSHYLRQVPDSKLRSAADEVTSRLLSIYGNAESTRGGTYSSRWALLIDWNDWVEGVRNSLRAYTSAMRFLGMTLNETGDAYPPPFPNGFFRIWDTGVGRTFLTPQMNWSLVNLSLYALNASTAEKVVYYDPSRNTSWVTPEAASMIKSLLNSYGFVTKNASELRSWMGTAGNNSVVVFAQDVCPDTVCDVPFPNAVVYYDTSYPTAWISATEAQSIKEFLVGKQFVVKDANGLKDWMDYVISNSVKDTVVVFAQDICPSTVCESPSTSSTIAKYLKAGGRVVWMGDVPFYYQGKAGGQTITWGYDGQSGILGVRAAQWNIGDTVSITSTGSAWGLSKTWNSIRPTVQWARNTSSSYTWQGPLYTSPYYSSALVKSYPWYEPISDNITIQFRAGVGSGDVAYLVTGGVINERFEGGTYTTRNKFLTYEPQPGGLIGEYWDQFDAGSWAYHCFVTLRIDSQINWGDTTTMCNSRPYYIYTVPCLGTVVSPTTRMAMGGRTKVWDPSGTLANCDNFMIRWFGYIKIDNSGTYGPGTWQICEVSDDGVRVWLDGAVYINNWFDGDGTESCGPSIYLSPGLHDIRVDYYENTGDNFIRLKWKPPGWSSSEVIPSDHLYYSVPMGAECWLVTDGSGANEGIGCQFDWIKWRGLDEGLKILASNVEGNPAAYLLNFHPEYPDSGFVRIWDFDLTTSFLDSNALDNLYNVATYGIRDRTGINVAGKDSLIRKYMDNGGRVVWIGDIPFYYVDRGGNKIQWDTLGMKKILGLKPASDVATTAQITKEGAERGLLQGWTSSRPVIKDDVTYVLARSGDNNASAFIKDFDLSVVELRREQGLHYAQIFRLARIAMQSLLSQPNLNDILDAFQTMNYWNAWATLKNQQAMLQNLDLVWKFANVTAEELPRILGDARGTTGLNYFLKYTVDVDRTSALEPFLDSALDFAKTFFQYSARLQQRKECVYGWNLIGNPSFERGSGSDAYNWSESTNAARVSGVSHLGDYSLRIAPTGSSQETWSDRIQVQPNTQYRMTMWVNASLTSGVALGHLAWYNSADTLISEAYTDYSVTSSGGKWYYLQVTATSPSNAAYARVHLAVNNSPSGYVWFDDVSLEKVTC